MPAALSLIKPELESDQFNVNREMENHTPGSGDSPPPRVMTRGNLNAHHLGKEAKNKRLHVV